MSDTFENFYKEIKEIEKRDSSLNSKTQIDRLNRPGSTYFNLNPYDVLQVDPDTSSSDVKKKYRVLSLLVHPDKNQGDIERAKKAFEAVNKAYKTMEDAESNRKCREVYEEAKSRVELMMIAKRTKLRKEGQPTEISEDDPQKLFADLERLRVDEEAKLANERKRKAEKDEQERTLIEYDKEYRKNFEESRNERVTSWRDFKTKKSKTTKGLGGLRPPKTKMEKRSF